MASTPPAQIRAEARTPPTPLHGSAYHDNPSPSRYHFRSSRNHVTDSKDSSFTQSPQSSRAPQSPRDNPFDLHSPQATPKRKSARRVQVLSPTSPDSSSEFVAQTHTKQQNNHYLSANTIMSEGMLPTPVKTPQKKQLPKSTMAARVLFQDQLNTIPASPRKQPKRRHNGFSMERDATPTEEIAIFTDSRDQLPQVDPSSANPFYSSPKPKKRNAHSSDEAPAAPGPSKRRKVTPKAPKKLDPQVEEAIENDEGMVYVFRGKKVYRRFEDAGDEEEVIDANELGLLERHGAREIIKPLKTLTRKSIRPRRLFQEAKQPSQSDEEADTEIEDSNQAELAVNEDEEQPSPSRSTRSQAKKVVNGGSRKKTSPFDTWRRLKSGSGSTMSTESTIGPSSAKGRKRTAAEALEV